MMIVMVLPTIAPSYQIEKLDAEKERYGDRHAEEGKCKGRAEKRGIVIERREKSRVR
jgi:hypothetical protein